MEIIWTLLLAPLTLLYAISGEDAPGFEGFPPPTFASEWNRVSNKDDSSLTEMPHGLGEVPIMVKVLARVLEGDNAGFIFEGTGVAQTDDDDDDKYPRGGVLYVYSRDSVTIWLPTPYKKGGQTNSVYIGGAWGSGRHAVSAEEIEVQVLAWSPRDFYPPDFVSERQEIAANGFTYISMDMSEDPVLVKVTGSFKSSDDTLYVDGTGSQQSDLSNGDDAGGILFAYNSAGVRIWASPEFLLSTEDGWGEDRKPMKIKKFEITVRAWKFFNNLLPSMNLEVSTSLPSFGTFLEFEYSHCPAVRHVRVTLMAGEEPNAGFLFDATGMAQTSGDARVAGGAVIAYNESHIRTWFLDKSMAPNSGTIVVSGWGGEHYQQTSTAAKVIYQVWCVNNTVTLKLPRDIGNSCNRCLIPHANQTPLMLIRSINTRSMAGCVHLCLSNSLCSTVGMDDGVCYLFADLLFGPGAYMNSSLKLYRIADAQN